MQEYVDEGALSAMKKWLEPLPDKTLPQFEIRSLMLELLALVFF